MKKLTLLLLIIFSTLLQNDVTGQGLRGMWKEIKEKGKQGLDSVINGTVDGIANSLFNPNANGKQDKTSNTQKDNEPGTQINTVVTTTNATSTIAVKSGDTVRPRLSEIHDADFVQNAGISKQQPGYTRIPIAQNLLIDIKGIYPEGYAPKWRFISYPSDLLMDQESWYYPRSTVQKEKYPLSITAYNGKAVLRVKPFYNAEAFADIVIKDNVAVITGNPQTFQITNFRRILNDRSTNEPIKGMGNQPANQGGFEGKLTLSANENGDITMSYMVENYSVETFRIRKVFDRVSKTYTEEKANHKPAQVSWRYIAKDINVENEMSAEKAIAIIEAEKKAKQAQKDYEAKSKKQADSVLKIIAKKYPEAQCRECFYSSMGGYMSSSTREYIYENGDPAPSRTSYDYRTVISIKNKCKYDLLFVGIQQLYNEAQGYYLKEVTKTMPAGYDYSSDKGAFATLFDIVAGGGSDFNINVQDSYSIKYATVGAVQWLKVIKSK